MIVGVTGSQRGASHGQLIAARAQLLALDATELHHGDCIGADAQLHEVARELDLRVVIHPPRVASKRAWCSGDFMHPPLPYLDRNRALVAAVEALIATPRGAGTRSGTQYTIRQGRALLGEDRVFVL